MDPTRSIMLPLVVALFQLTTGVVQLADSTMVTQLHDAWVNRSQSAELCITGHQIRRHNEPARLVLTRFIPVQASDSACTDVRYIGAVYLTTADSSYQEVMFAYGTAVLKLNRQWYLVLFVYGLTENGHPKIVVVSY